VDVWQDGFVLFLWLFLEKYRESPENGKDGIFSNHHDFNKEKLIFQIFLFGSSMLLFGGVTKMYSENTGDKNRHFDLKYHRNQFGRQKNNKIFHVTIVQTSLP